MRDKIPAIWKFERRIEKEISEPPEAFWEVHRHRMPKASLDIINNLQVQGKFEILSGHRKGITSNNGEIVFQFISKAGRKERSIPVDFVINCTGPSGDYLETGNWLIKNLLAKGWMKQDDLRLGIVTGADGEIITAGAGPLLNAFAIGPLRKASEWESTAIREIKNQAEALALALASDKLQPTVLEPLCKSLPPVGVKGSFRLFKRA